MNVRLSDTEAAALAALDKADVIDAATYASRTGMTLHEARVVFYRLCGIGAAKRVPGVPNTFQARRYTASAEPERLFDQPR